MEQTRGGIEGADQEAKADGGATQLHEAAAKGFLEAIRVLVWSWALRRRRRWMVEPRRCTGRHTTGRWRRSGC